jgi:hypothetical protein
MINTTNLSVEPDQAQYREKCGRRESNPHREHGVLASSPLNDDHETGP